jgi:hypothetical protein
MRHASLPIVVVALLAVMLGAQAVYAPKFPGDPAHSDAEAVALGYMRTVVNAERLYQKKHGKYATSLYGLVGSGSFTRRMVKTDRGDYSVGFHPGFSLQMIPKVFDAQHRSFWVNEEGIIHADDSQPATHDSSVLKP